jgi:hypothetical protein
MKIENSINPMPASRAERSSLCGEILVSRFIDDRVGALSVMAGLVLAIHDFGAALF